jgi:hypothetical protein|nr:MAG TPA: terminase small subunit [Caudoviricetes sp.]
MGKNKNLPPTRVKYWEELKEIEEAAKAANCDTNFFYRTTLDRYVDQLDLLEKARKSIEEDGLTIIQITPRGAEREIPNPAVQTYNQTASASNSTVQTLLRIVQTYKFMAAKEDEDDEL